MKDFKEMDEVVFRFGDDLNKFAEKYSGRMPPAIKTQLQDYMYTGFAKEIEAMTEQEEVEIKCRKKFYDKLLKTKSKLANIDRADAWFNKVFEKYFNRGLLEHLIVYAARFLHKKDLFVAKRLFVQINDDELLAEFTRAACEYLGWTDQNESTEPPTIDENEDDEQQQEIDETNADDENTTPDEEQCTDVTVYEPKEVQPAEQQAQPVVKVERTVTHEVMTATQGGTIPPTGASDVVAADDEESAAAPNGELPSFFRPGGKSTK